MEKNIPTSSGDIGKESVKVKTNVFATEPVVNTTLDEALISFDGGSVLKMDRMPLSANNAGSLSTTEKTPKKVYAILTPPTPEELAAVNKAKIGTHFRGADTLTVDDQEWLRAHGYNA